jgi:23S rRNA (guanine745-N1)-methyltransferase
VGVVLLCPVRSCHRPLTRGDRRLVCPRTHSFDVARSGYVNLLQPQDRRSSRPGDSAVAVHARRRLSSQGFEADFVDAIAGFAAAGADDAVLDVGCGEGQHLAAIAARSGCEGHGLDISVDTIAAAARRHPRLGFVVANADRFLPYADASFRVVTSVTARTNAAEFRRVLQDDGRLMFVVPAADDLIELRAAILGERIERDRTPSAITALSPPFTLERHERLRRVVRLDPASIRDVMAASYRALRTSQRARLTALGPLSVTLSRDVLLFRPAEPRAPASP